LIGKKETPSFLVSLAFQKLCNSALQSAPHRTKDPQQFNKIQSKTMDGLKDNEKMPTFKQTHKAH
jgi:hypothetical protein